MAIFYLILPDGMGALGIFLAVLIVGWVVKQASTRS